MEKFDMTRSVDEDANFAYVGPVSFTDGGTPVYLRFNKTSPTWCLMEEFNHQCIQTGQSPLSLYHKTQAFFWFYDLLTLMSPQVH